jgi:hypothetical protein
VEPSSRLHGGLACTDCPAASGADPLIGHWSRSGLSKRAALGMMHIATEGMLVN